MGIALRLLLDTNTFFWWTYEQEHLSPRASRALKSAEEVFVSLVCYWEIAIKHRIERMQASELLAEGPAALAHERFLLLPIEYPHVAGTLRLPLHHRDPFDRLLLAQAQVEGLTIVSSDRTFDRYDVKRIW